MSNEITFVTSDPEAIQNGLVSAVEAATGETLYPADARRIFIQQLAAALVAVYASIDDTARQGLLRYARGAVLDALGEMSDTPRLPPESAAVMMEFTASPGHPTVTIPAGTRVTPDGLVYYETVAQAIIAVDATTVQVEATAMETGSKYNGFAPGQIALIVDPLPYLASAANVTASEGGADWEPDGSTTPPYSDYRARIREAPARYSTAGPEDAYVYWAKTADQNIGSVSATSPSAAEILITVLMDGGAAPTQDVLDAVLAACSARTVRPLGDHVIAQAPVWVDFTINVAYTINAACAGNVAAIRAAIEGAGGAVEQYTKWQTSEIGRAVTPSQLIRYMYGAGDYDEATRQLLAQGVNSVTITAPVAAPVSQVQAARLSGAATINYNGAV